MNCDVDRASNLRLFERSGPDVCFCRIEFEILTFLGKEDRGFLHIPPTRRDIAQPFDKKTIAKAAVLAVNDEKFGLRPGQMPHAAVTGGLGSAAWEKYMRQFVSNDDPEQLSRLLATDDTAKDSEMIERRAYLVSNGVCGEGTRDRFDDDVKSLDAGLEANC